jgi:hypothetical protein
LRSVGRSESREEGRSARPKGRVREKEGKKGVRTRPKRVLVLVVDPSSVEAGFGRFRETVGVVGLGRGDGNFVGEGVRHSFVV